MPFHTRNLIAFAVVAALWPAAAHAQRLGTFHWRMARYCNVLSLDVIAEGTMYRLQGTDDWCGAGPLPVRGAAVLGSDGRVYMGLTITPRDLGYETQPETQGLFVSVTLSLSTLNGEWRDNRGDSGEFLNVAAGHRGLPNPPRLLGHNTLRHFTSATNTIENTTCLAVDDPNAKLLVQYNRRSQTAIGPNLASTLSVYYADLGTGLLTPGLERNVWCIRLENRLQMPLGALFTVQVLR